MTIAPRGYGELGVPAPPTVRARSGTGRRSPGARRRSGGTRQLVRRDSAHAPAHSARSVIRARRRAAPIPAPRLSRTPMRSSTNGPRIIVPSAPLSSSDGSALAIGTAYAIANQNAHERQPTGAAQPILAHELIRGTHRPSTNPNATVPAAPIPGNKISASVRIGPAPDQLLRCAVISIESGIQPPTNTSQPANTPHIHMGGRRSTTPESSAVLGQGGRSFMLALPAAALNVGRSDP